MIMIINPGKSQGGWEDAPIYLPPCIFQFWHVPGIRDNSYLIVILRLEVRGDHRRNRFGKSRT